MRIKHCLTVATAVAAVALTAGMAQARPVTVDSTPTQCDGGAPNTNHELGTAQSTFAVPGFSPMESITASVIPTSQVACQSTVTGNNHFLVSITNTTGVAWEDLWFVADEGLPQQGPFGPLPAVLTNDDALISETGLMLPGLGFRIDNIGVNTPLIGESLNADLIFDIGETWQFIVQDWLGDILSVITIEMASLGVGGASNQDLVGGLISNASIIARLYDPNNNGTPMPEPGTLALFGLGLAGLGLARRRKVAK